MGKNDPTPLICPRTGKRLFIRRFADTGRWFLSPLSRKVDPDPVWESDYKRKTSREWRMIRRIRGRLARWRWWR